MHHPKSVALPSRFWPSDLDDSVFGNAESASRPTELYVLQGVDYGVNLSTRFR